MAWWPFHPPCKRFTNLEGDRDYDFALARAGARPGVSALLRVRNEAAKISYCLRSILPLFDEIIVVDNGSEDHTGDRVRELMTGEGPGGKIRLYSYPHRLARFGPEHEATPDSSLRSAVYYSNWALSHCSCRFVCKWDGDMVLVRAVRDRFARFLQEIQQGRPRRWTLAGQTIYRDQAGRYHLAAGEINREVEVFPNGYGCRFRKDRHWERLGHPPFMSRSDFAPVAFFELKFTDEDEFAHWSTRAWPSPRKRREWENFNLVQSGRASPPAFEDLGLDFLERETG